MREGRLRGLVEHRGRVTARVRGTREYQVELGLGNGEPDYSCTCPVGRDGVFCKHCVVVGLAWLDRREGSPPKSRRAAKPTITPADVRAGLAALSRDELVALLMTQAKEDDRFWRKLVLETARRRPKGIDVAAYRHAIDDAVDAGDFVSYREAFGFAQGIDEVIDGVEALLRQGHAAEVIELTEHALLAVEGTMESVDDSDGLLGGVLSRLHTLHHTACRKARPDPKSLAKRLFDWELRSDWDLFSGAAATYADVLGKEGLAAYRALAETHWARVRPIGPTSRDSERSGKRFRITSIMETLARERGDLEALIAIKQRDLSMPYHFLEIADLYRQAGNHDSALEWAERGMRAFPEHTDARLREFLAEEYHRRNRHDEAMALVWAEVEAAPYLQQVQNLKRHADRTGRWKEWRSRAIARVRDQIALPRHGRNPIGWPAQADHSELVRIFLWEGDLDAAWREAREGGCSDTLWLDLATRLANDHPEDALEICRRQVAPTLTPATNDAYREAVALLRRIRGLMLRLEREEDFRPYVESIRTIHKRKRNFIRMLDRAKW